MSLTVFLPPVFLTLGLIQHVLGLAGAPMYSALQLKKNPGDNVYPK